MFNNEDTKLSVSPRSRHNGINDTSNKGRKTVDALKTTKV